MEETREKIGKITHFFDKIGVGVFEVTAPVKVGDKIYIQSNEPFEQEITSMQVEHSPVEKAKAGDAVGLKLDGKVNRGDSVFKA